jgi:ABC-type polysaccharide/polyol phosphate transport system ATPase subunit
LQTLPNGTIAATDIWKRFRADRRPAKLQDQFLKFGEKRKGLVKSGWRWALRDIDLRANPGDSIGLIGPNGSGKTTLLKILTRVMYQTAGSLSIEGRVGALITLSAGIHPNLTGRENIVLTGSLMGLSRKQVNAQFDEIVGFAELEQAIDRQAKYYSAGMLARLGFGVAAFLEPEILLVDEVLAVGDAAFQQRCLDRLRTILASGTTLVFVSHDLPSVEAVCSRGVWLNNGVVVEDGPVREVLSNYRRAVERQSDISHNLSGRVKIIKTSVSAPNDMVQTNSPVEFELEFESDGDYRGWLYFGVTEGTASPIFIVNPGTELLMKAGERITARCVVERLPVPRGPYSLWAGMWQDWEAGDELLAWQPVANFTAYGPRLDQAPRAVVRLAPLHVDTDWTVSRA